MSHRNEPTDTTAQVGASGNEPENPGSEGIVTETSSPEGADAGQTQPITLNDFIKTSGLVGTGGQAKLLIQAGDVVVNGEVETRRRRKLWPGDSVSLLGQTAVVPAGGEPR
jgi:ribosome-associated protein